MAGLRAGRRRHRGGGPLRPAGTGGPVTADGYRWNGRAVDRRSEVAALRRGLPAVGEAVYVRYLHDMRDEPGNATGWNVTR